MIEQSREVTPSNDQSAALELVRVTMLFFPGGAVVEAINDVSLRIARGSFKAIMGPSGSGKSTLLHVLAGLTRPDQGQVFVEGRDVTSMTDHQATVFRRRNIGLVFQAFNLIPTLTARENILLPALAEGNAHEMGQRLESLLDHLGLQHRGRHRPDALSGGEQQRVAIARAMILGPTVLLADEPTGSVDSAAGQAICRLLQSLCRDHGRTILVVTHEPTVALWAERVIVLADGRIIGDFPVDQSGDAHRLAALYHDLVGSVLSGRIVK